MHDLSVTGRALPPGAELLAPPTQIVGDRADYLGESTVDIGQRIAEDKLELFVVADPAQALLQQLTALQPEFIVLHDVGVSQSLRLIGAIATALNTRVHTLSIRRQGRGMALATLPFVELPGRSTQRLRVYSTDIDTEPQSRRLLGGVLLSHARLGVVMVGEMPRHLLGGALQPLRDAITKGPWPNRELLMVPMGEPAALAAQAATLAGPPGLNVRMTPRAASANDAWTYVTGAWNRLREAGAHRPARVRPRPATAQAPSPIADAPTQPMPLPGASPGLHDVAVGRWNDYLDACTAIKGLVSACVFEVRSGQPLAHRGAHPQARHLVTEGMKLLTTLAGAGRGLGLGSSQPDAAITLTGHHLLLHPLPRHPGIVLHAVLDASAANLTLARMQLQRVDAAVLAV